jgi:hypothetical protein
LEISNVSEQNAEQTSGDPASVNAAPAVPNSTDTQSEPTASEPTAFDQSPVAEIAPVDSPDLLAGEAAASVETQKKADATTPDAPTAEAAADLPSKLILMSPGEDKSGRGSNGRKPEPKSRQARSGMRRVSAVAAVAVLAAVTGALGGALATGGLSHVLANDSDRNDKRALEASVARIEADMVALKAGLEHTSKITAAQVSKTGERIDKLEKAQAEPAARIAKLSEAVEKLRATPAIAPVPVSVPLPPSKDVTGSVAPVAAATPATPKAEIAKLPKVDGWSLRDVANGGALIQGRLGIFEVYAGDAVPGLGRVDAIRRQDGRWVVVTSKGLIVAR